MAWACTNERSKMQWVSNPMLGKLNERAEHHVEAVSEAKGHSWHITDLAFFELLAKHVISCAGIHGLRFLIGLTVGAQGSKKSPHLGAHRWWQSSVSSGSP